MAMFLQQRVQVTGRFTMKMQIKSRWNRMEYRQAVTAVIVGAVFSLAGCASVAPPKEQLAVTKAAVENASTADSTEFAPVELRAARVFLCVVVCALVVLVFVCVRCLVVVVVVFVW